MYAEGVNFIYMGAFNDRDRHTLTKAFEDSFEFFRQYELYPTYIRLDNGKSKLFKSMCKGRVVDLQYVPPGQHRGTKTGKTRILDSLARFPTPLAPPIPTKEVILATAAEDLEEAAKHLTNKKIDLDERGHTLASKIRKLDQYIQIYHPWTLKQDLDDTKLLFEQLWPEDPTISPKVVISDGPPP
jgi:hypothetical protein